MLYENLDQGSTDTEDCLGHEACTRFPNPAQAEQMRMPLLTQLHKGGVESHADKSGAKPELGFPWDLLLQGLPGTQERRQKASKLSVATRPCDGSGLTTSV